MNDKIKMIRMNGIKLLKRQTPPVMEMKEKKMSRLAFLSAEQGHTNTHILKERNKKIPTK